MSFYESLTKPSWVPPDWAFPVAWFTLWALQAVALVRLSALAGGPGNGVGKARGALGALIVQFVVSIAWQGLIFGPGRLLLAAIWLTVLLTIEVLTVGLCLRAQRVAGLLVAPTIVWVSVATALGWSLFRLNPKK